MADSLADRFVAHLPAGTRQTVGDRRRLDELLSQITKEAGILWRGFSLGLDDYLAHLAGCLADSTDPVEDLEDLHATDLYLALACARGDERAIVAYQRKMKTALKGAIFRAGGGSQAEDIEQRVWELVLTPTADHPPQIATYAGKASLRNWTFVIAIRTAKRMMSRSRSEEMATDDELLEAWPDQHDDEEVAHLKRLYSAEFKSAFQQALGSLTHRDRTMLRMHLLEGVSLPQLGEMFGVHRATVFRWMQGIHEKLLRRTRKALGKHLQLPPEETEDIMHLVHDEIDASIDRILAPSGPEDPEESGSG